MSSNSWVLVSSRVSPVSSSSFVIIVSRFTDVVEDGKWVTDDYYEDEALAKCAENGYTPYGPVQDEEIMINAHATSGAMTRAEREREALTSALKSSALSPFYTIGGPSTHFGGSGVDPWTEGGSGNRRSKLRGYGVTEEDWMYRTALESRAIDASLRDYRQERIGTLEGDDLKGWVWTMENREEDDEGAEAEAGEDVKADGAPSPGSNHATLGRGLKPPMDRKRSALSREVTFEPEPELDAEGEGEGDAEGEVEHPSTDEALTPLAATDGDISMEVPDVRDTAAAAERDGQDQAQDQMSAALNGANGLDEKGDTIRVETAEELSKRKAKWSYGTGSWAPGTIKAAYEVSLPTPNIDVANQLTVLSAPHPHASCPTSDPTNFCRLCASIPIPHSPIPERWAAPQLRPIDRQGILGEGTGKYRIRFRILCGWATGFDAWIRIRRRSSEEDGG